MLQYNGAIVIVNLFVTAQGDIYFAIGRIRWVEGLVLINFDLYPSYYSLYHIIQKDG